MPVATMFTKAKTVTLSEEELLEEMRSLLDKETEELLQAGGESMDKAMVLHAPLTSEQSFLQSPMHRLSHQLLRVCLAHVPPTAHAVDSVSKRGEEQAQGRSPASPNLCPVAWEGVSLG